MSDVCSKSPCLLVCLREPYNGMFSFQQVLKTYDGHNSYRLLPETTLLNKLSIFSGNYSTHRKYPIIDSCADIPVTYHTHLSFITTIDISYAVICRDAIGQVLPVP